MTGDSEAGSGVYDEIARLRRRLDELIAENAPAMADAAGRAQDAAREQLDTLADQVRARPLTSVLVAAGLGYALARLLRR